MTSSTWRTLRALRFDPPGFANGNGRGTRRATFQAALEQCEQFVKAAKEADYATRPLQLFYAMSQGTRAVVTASPRIGQGWRIHGHGLSAWTESQSLTDVTVCAKGDGLFQAMATVLGFQPIKPEEEIRLGDLWPLVPESIQAPLDKHETLSAITFCPGGWPQHHLLYGAELRYIRPEVPARYGEDKDALARHFARYPALQGISWTANLGVPWQITESTVSLGIQFDLIDGQRPALIEPGARLTARYPGLHEKRILTPSVGSMEGPLHPILAWWAVLLALSSLARYEPASWSKMIDINSSPHATAVEHLLDEAVEQIPDIVLALLTNIDDPG